jgi:hypothetical protein
MSSIRLHEPVSLKGSKIVGTLNGRGYSLQKDGKVVDRYIVKIDPKKVTLHDIAPFLDEIVIDPDRIQR